MIVAALLGRRKLYDCVLFKLRRDKRIAERRKLYDCVLFELRSDNS